MYKCPFEPIRLVKATQTVGHGRRHLWSKNEKVLFLGEIKQTPGLCAVATSDGRVHWGHRTNDFIEPTEDEI